MIKTNIIEKVDQQQLDEKLKIDLDKKYVRGEHWFRYPKLWYELTAFSNPYVTVYSELVLLIQNMEKIYGFLSKKTLVLYGLGTGDTEMILVNSLLKKEKFVDIIGLEVQAKFIDGFIQSLENISIEDEDYKINFLGINGLFEEISKEDFKIGNNKRAHIILGNTIGNFEENEIFEKLNSLMGSGDILLIGFQTDENIDNIFKQYSENKMFNDFIKKNISSSNELRWLINKGKSQIEAWDNDILVFHSKKKNPESMMNCVENFGFRNLYSINDTNSCIQIFEKP